MSKEEDEEAAGEAIIFPMERLARLMRASVAALEDHFSRAQ